MNRGALLLVCLLPVGALAQGWGGSSGDIVKKEDPKANKISDFASAANAAKADADKPGGTHDADVFNFCLKAYDSAIAAGVPASQEIDQNGLKGSMQTLKESICDAGKAAFEAKEEARTGPYKKVLKNDKYDIWKDYSAALILPGGARTTPANLAKASHWYVDTSPPERCANGTQRHRVHKYDFGGNQKLKKTTDKNFCGEPPSSALN